jgi:polysaccharide export outer membrane protein
MSRTREVTSIRQAARVLGFVICLGVSIAGQSGQEEPAPSQPEAGYRLGPRDVVAVSVWGHPELGGKFTLAADGNLSLPLVGALKASDRTVPELQADVTARFADGYLRNPRVIVEIERYVSQRVFVMGEVRTPGPVGLTGTMTLLEALARAGSFTEQAGGDLQVLRPATNQTDDSPTSPGQSNISELARLSVQQLRRGASGANILLHNGDTVFVPRAENIFVLGLVSNPGTYTLESGMTVLRALSAAGGTTALGSTGRIRITRVVDGRKTEIKARLDDVLKPDDTIVVGARRF